MALQFLIICFSVLCLCSKFIEWNEKKVLFRRKKLYYSLCRIVTSAQADFLLRLARMLGGTQKVWSEPPKKKSLELFSFVDRRSWKALQSIQKFLSAGRCARAWPRNASTHTHTLAILACGVATTPIFPVCDQLTHVHAIYESCESSANYPNITWSVELRQCEGMSVWVS